MKMFSFIISLSTIFMVACSSGSKKDDPGSKISAFEGPERELKKDYIVVDAQYKQLPTWLNEPEKWAEEYDKQEYKDMRYFVSEAGPVNDKSMACEYAKAKASANVASEITQFIKNSFGASAMGDPTSTDEKLEEYVENTLAKEVQTFIVGAHVFKTYWEQRNYKKDLGAEEDRRGFICNALVKIDRKNLEKAIKQAQNKLEGVTENPETKKKIEKAMEKADEAFSQLNGTKPEAKQEAKKE